MKKILYIFIVLITLSTTVVFSGCNNNGSTTDGSTTQSNAQESVVELTTTNFGDYLYLQQESLSFNRTDYVKNDTFQMARVTQTMKLSVLKVSSKIKSFNNVTLTIVNGTYAGQWWSQSTGYFSKYYWDGPGGSLTLSYEGEGVLVLTAVYDGYASEVNSHQLSYKISGITGSLTLVE